MSASDMLVLIDGEPTEDPAVLLSLVSEKNVSVFETMRVSGSSIFQLSRHLDRLFESAKTIGIQIPKGKKQIKAELREALKHTPFQEPFFLRLTILSSHTIVFVFRRDYPTRLYEEGVDIKTTAVCRNESSAFPPEAKIGQFLNAILSYLDPFSADAFELLFLNREGTVTETRASNFFIVKNKVLETPEPRGILNGVTRRFVIECARKERFSVCERPITRHDVWNADEAFMTNTTSGIVPVRSLDGRTIGEGKPGPVTLKLRRRFEMEFRREVAIRKNSYAPH